MKRITIVKLRKPQESNVNKELQWFSESLGLFSERDKEKSCFRIFVELVKATRVNRALSSDEIAQRSHLTRGTVIHHLHKLEETGIIIHEEKKYLLRVNTLEELITEMQKDAERVFEELYHMATLLDEELGLQKRKQRQIIE